MGNPTATLSRKHARTTRQPQPASKAHLRGNSGGMLVGLDDVGVRQVLSQHSLYELPHAVHLFTATLDCRLHNLHQQQGVSRGDQRRGGLMHSRWRLASAELLGASAHLGRQGTGCSVPPDSSDICSRLSSSPCRPQSSYSRWLCIPAAQSAPLRQELPHYAGGRQSHTRQVWGPAQ